MKEAFINQISREQHSVRYKKALPILPNNHMVWFPWFTKYTDQNSLACEAQYVHLPCYRVSQDHSKDSKSPIPEKSCNTSTFRRALKHVLRAPESQEYRLCPGTSPEAGSLHCTHHCIQSTQRVWEQFMLQCGSSRLFLRFNKEKPQSISSLIFPSTFKLTASKVGIYRTKWMLTLMALFTLSPALSESQLLFINFLLSVLQFMCKRPSWSSHYMNR